MRKWTIWGLTVVLALAGFWYFFIKSHDFRISFQTSAAPGIVYLRALHWKPNIDPATKKVPYKSFIQQMEFNGASVELEWKFTPVKDSVTLVQIHSKALEANFTERLKLLVVKTDQQKKIIQEISSFRDVLEKDEELFDIKIEGEARIPQTRCACIPLESSIEKKAVGMMKNINLLNDYKKLHHLDLDGKPRVQVTDWNTTTNKIKFDFCFPLTGTENLPNTSSIRIKELPSQKALKAIFHGNYIFSHNAWLQLLNYAELNGYEVTGPPLEIFINNPELGGNSRNWEAEIYLPVK